MIVGLKIKKNKHRAPYIEKIYKGAELVKEKPANVLAYYEVTVVNTGQMSIFDVSLSDNEVEIFAECDSVFNENDSLRDYLLALEIKPDKVDDLMELVINQIVDLYYSKNENSILELGI